MVESIRIVIADDHPIVREGLATVLNQEEDLAVVGQAGNGLEAVAKVRNSVPMWYSWTYKCPKWMGLKRFKR